MHSYDSSVREMQITCMARINIDVKKMTTFLSISVNVLVDYGALICAVFFPVVPHITDAIQERVMRQAKVSVDDDGVEPEVCVIEVQLL